MLRKIAGILGLIMVTALLTVTITSSPAQAADCVIKTNTDSGRFELSRPVNVSVSVHFRHCVGVHGNRWVDPISYTVRANVSGDHIDCGSPVNYVRGVKWNGYFSDGRGVNFNPPGFRTDCEVDTVTEVTKSLSMAPNFKYCRGVPKWKFNVELDLWLADNPELTLRGPMWGFTGPVVEDCD